MKAVARKHPVANASNVYFSFCFMSIIKKRQPHKPGSVTIFADGLYHQSTAVVADGLYQPTPRQRASQPLNGGIFGLSAHEAVCLSVALSVSRTLSFLLPSR